MLINEAWKSSPSRPSSSWPAKPNYITREMLMTQYCLPVESLCSLLKIYHRSPRHHTRFCQSGGGCQRRSLVIGVPATCPKCQRSSPAPTFLRPLRRGGRGSVLECPPWPFCPCPHFRRRTASWCWNLGKRERKESHNSRYYHMYFTSPLQPSLVP